TAPPETESPAQFFSSQYTNGVSLELNNIYFSYSTTSVILSSISFKLDPGEVLLISGKSGCGKSTLVKIILGLLPPTGGHIICNDVNILEH
ncbi:ATP-binding cassette domain-containing protein, partial [Escherichia coli]